MRDLFFVNNLIRVKHSNTNWINIIIIVFFQNFNCFCWVIYFLWCIFMKTLQWSPLSSCSVYNQNAIQWSLLLDSAALPLKYIAVKPTFGQCSFTIKIHCSEAHFWFLTLQSKCNTVKLTFKQFSFTIKMHYSEAHFWTMTTFNYNAETIEFLIWCFTNRIN